MDLKSFFVHTLTYWAKTGHDGFGGATFAAPVSFAGKYLNKQELFRNAAGVEERSQAIAYTGGKIADPPHPTILNGGYLVEGAITTADPLVVAGAREIRAVNESISIDGTTTLLKIFL